MRRKGNVLVALFIFVFLIGTQINAQDKPDGFASLSGHGLETTTGGEGGEVVEATSYVSLNLYATSSKPYIIVVKGLIESTSWREIKVNSNKTIVGYGTDATLKNIELNIVDKKNIIIRNLIIRDSYVEGDYDGKTNDNDAIQVDNSHHLWIDHCFFTHCGDGLLDIRKACDNVTISYVHLSNHNKAFGIGWTDSTNWYMTIHHCWFENTNQRNPSFDQGYGHLYNNYVSGITSYGNLSRGNAHVVIQNSYFYQTKNPLQISDNGILYSSGNQFVGCSGSNTGNTSVMPFDPATFYSYTLDATADVVSIVTSQSGPQGFVSDQYMASANKVYSANAGIDVRWKVNRNQNSIQLFSNEPEEVRVFIYTLDGKMQLSKVLTETGVNEIPLHGLAKGICLMRMVSDNQQKTVHIVVP